MIYTNPGSCVGEEDSYVVACGMEYSGGGLTTLADVTDIESCVDSCANDDDCMAVAFDTASQVCYEKSSVVFGNAMTGPSFIFAFSARYVDRGMYPLPVTGTSMSEASTMGGSGTNIPGGISVGTVSQAITTVSASSPSLSSSGSNSQTVQLSSLSPGLSASGADQSLTTLILNKVSSTTQSRPTFNSGEVGFSASSPILSNSPPSIPDQANPQSVTTTTTDSPTPSSTPTMPVSQACPQNRTSRFPRVQLGMSIVLRCTSASSSIWAPTQPRQILPTIASRLAIV